MYSCKRIREIIIILKFNHLPSLQADGDDFFQSSKELEYLWKILSSVEQA
jgi:hypothetical protein